MHVDLDKALHLPADVRHHIVDDLHLFIAPNNPAWVSTDEHGALLLLCLHQGATIREALSITCAATGRSPETMHARVANLVAAILARGFLAQDAGDAPELALSLHLYVTRACNFRCGYCYMDAGDALDTELPTKAWLRIIDDYTHAALGHKVHFSGGEPLLRKDILELGRHARHQGNVARLFTNGWLLAHQDPGALLEAFDNIQISLDGATASVHDGYRGDGSLERVAQGLRLLRDLGISRTLAVNVFPENVDNLVAHLGSFVAALKDDSLEVHLTYDVIPFGRSRDVSTDHYPACEIPEKVNQLLRHLVELGLPRVQDIVMNTALRNCGIGATLAIDADGKAYPCAIPYLAVGSARDEPMTDLIAKLVALRDKTNIDAFQDCHACDIRYVCLGGCRVSHYLKTGSFIQPNCTDKKRERKYRQMAYMLPIGLKS